MSIEKGIWPEDDVAAEVGILSLFVCIMLSNSPGIPEYGLLAGCIAGAAAGEAWSPRVDHDATGGIRS